MSENGTRFNNFWCDNYQILNEIPLRIQKRKSTMMFKMRVNFGSKLLTHEHIQITAQHTVENNEQAENL